MFTALYYPRIKVGIDLFKNSLFLWDRLEYITPVPDFRAWYEDAELNDAVTAFAVPHVPSQEEKQQANDAIVDLLSHPLPDWFYLKQDQIPDGLRYGIYPPKFLPQTWDILQDRGLAKPLGDGYDTTAALGLTMMSILADCCAGTEKRLVTDETASYSVLDRYLATIGGAELGKFDDKSERLVTISLKVMNFKEVKLARLVELRQKERTASGAHLTALRHGYLKKIEEHAEKLNKAKTKPDVEELERVFEQEMQKDFELLKDELKDEAKKVIFSAEMATAAVGLATSFFSPMLGLGLAGGALYKKKVEYRAARNKALKGHPMSWVYSLKRLPLV